MANNANNIKTRDIRYAMQIGVPKAERLARQYLVKQYRKSGLKVRTGGLIGMLKRASLSIMDSTSSKVSLLISMPAGLNKKEYKKANSINYGAVRSGKNSLLSAKNAKGNKAIGAKQLANLKSAGQNAKTSQGFMKVSRDIGIRGTGEKTSNGSVILDTTAGQATITKAWKFFYLLESQLDTIKAVIFDSTMEHLRAKITGKKAIRRAA